MAQTTTPTTQFYCAECGAPLAANAVDDFCGDACAAAWETKHTKTCTHCDGDCVVEEVYGWVGLSWQPRTRIETCETCKGRGVVYPSFSRDAAYLAAVAGRD